MDAPSRRAILAGTAAGLAGVTACQKYGEPTSTPAPAPANTVLGKTADIPVGGGVIFAANQVVVTQPDKDTFKAFSAVCTHMGCIVATVSDGTINCDCHGSKYAVATGAVVAGPAPRPLPPEEISITGGTITLT
ncbi:Rieske (2Fe-2S) protein [Kribbella sp. NPDC048915]|uniref:Rieske (2Fe-2S) protein n=1 Tax=Kribbella sp. NPDC048915 TaxID=3155148 RepID=UPI003407D885